MTGAWDLTRRGDGELSLLPLLVLLSSFLILSLSIVIIIVIIMVMIIIIGRPSASSKLIYVA